MDRDDSVTRCRHWAHRSACRVRHGVEACHRSAVPDRRSADLGVHRAWRKLRRACRPRTAHRPSRISRSVAKESRMIHLQAMLLAFGAATTASDTTVLTVDSLMVELKKGGYVVLLRHARTDYSTMDNPKAAPTDRTAQRNLSNEGIDDAKMIGRVFKKFGI